MDNRVEKFLLISIDCWRYDALSRTNPTLCTPKFDLVTQDFSFADRFFVTAPATRPSHTSLFTGLYPFEHGLYGQTYLKMFDQIQNLFQIFDQAGYRTLARSQRPDVFRFLDFESYITLLDPNAKQQHLGSLENFLEALKSPEESPQFCFLHLWYTHGGYGMGGVRSSPNLQQLVHQGKTEEALQFYYAAATHVLEFMLVEILKSLPLDEWAIFIFGDHGEGFCDEVMAHGDNLHQNVIRVPLLVNIPKIGQLVFPEDAPISMIDLFPTILNLAELNINYNGYGRDFLGDPREFQDRWVLTELDSLYGVGFLKPSNLETAHNRVTSRLKIDDQEIPMDPKGRRLWTMTNGKIFYRENEQDGDYIVRDVASGIDLPCEDPATFKLKYDELLINSRYQHFQHQETSNEEAEILENRLRNLGYID